MTRLGMTTIKVDDPDAALRELGAVVGFDLLGYPSGATSTRVSL